MTSLAESGQRAEVGLDVLLVEDDKPTRLFLERIIRARGHAVIACASAEEALEHYGKQFFPMVMTDVHLPGRSGLEITRTVRTKENGAYCYILVGTANNRPEDLREILDAGADDYISKPYNPALLNVRLTVAESMIQGNDKRRQLEGELKFLAQHDTLTGLNNRRQLTPALKHAIEAARKGCASAVLYLDLDNFKIVNDTLGHEAGDQLLTRVAGLLRKSTRKSDVLVRFGGDEFVIILVDCPAGQAVDAAKALLEKMEEIIFTGENRTFRVAASIGVAAVEPDTTPEGLMAAADAACYAAKARGRGRVELYKPETNELAKLIADTDWSTRILHAMKDGSLQLWFQPIVSTATGTMFFQEALLRYVPPGGTEAVNPSAFLSAIVRSGQMDKLDTFVVMKAFELLAERPDLTLSINISGNYLGEGPICEVVESQVKRTGVSPQKIILEITESDLIANLQTASRRMLRLQAMGFRFALDDFGAGFSSLLHLKNLPIDLLKIEGTFVQKLGTEPFNLAVLQAAKLLADVLKIETVAEFVEDVSDFEELRKVGITYAQGYFLSSPQPKPFDTFDIALAQS